MNWTISLQPYQPFKTLGLYQVPIYSLQFSPISSKILSSSESGFITVTDYATGRTLLTFRAHKVTINQTEYDRNEEKIVTCSDDRTLRVFDANSGKSLYYFDRIGAYVHRVSFSSCGNLLISSHFDFSVRIWSLKEKKEILKINHNAIVYCTSLSEDKSIIFSGHRWGQFQLFNMEGVCLKSSFLKEKDDFLRCSNFFDNDQKIITGSDQGYLRIFDIKSFQPLIVTKAHKSWIHNVAIYNDLFFMSASEHDGVKLFNNNFENLQTISTPCTSANIDKNFSKIILGTKKGTILVYPILHPHRGACLLLLCCAREFEKDCAFYWEKLPDELFLAILEYSNLII